MMVWWGEVPYLTMPAIFSANFPTLVPPNLRTTQPPGKCFSSVWFAIRSTSLLCPLVMPDMLVACVFSAIAQKKWICCVYMWRRLFAVCSN